MPATCITPYDVGAVTGGRGTDHSGVLQKALDRAVALNIALDLCGQRWQHRVPLYARGDLDLRSGELQSSGEGTALTIFAENRPVRARLHNVAFRKLSQTRRVGLRIVRGRGCQLVGVSFSNWRNGGCVALLLEGCHMTRWFGGTCEENDRHLLIRDVDGQYSTDTKLYGVFLSDARSGPCVSARGSTGLSLTDCSLDITRDGPLLMLNGCRDISLIGNRFEAPGKTLTGVHSSIQLVGGCRNVRLFGCFFGNTTPRNDTWPPIIDAGDTENLVLVANTFPRSSPPLLATSWQSAMNTGLPDS